MRFGIREICDVVLRAKAKQTLGSRTFYKNEPVLYFDTLKTSSLEGASTTVYAQGGRGNTRLVAWEGERTLTFTMEDALISPESFSILSGAGLIATTESKPIYQHTTSQVEVKDENHIILPNIACWSKYDKNSEYYNVNADIFVMAMIDGEISVEPCIPVSVTIDAANKTSDVECYSHAGKIEPGDIVLVDYYVKRTGGSQTIEITPDKFGGNYYLEASTLFRRESDGVDMPAEFVIPNCKVQSNFTFSMASSGDPSTFTFTMDAFPDYTKFDKTHKVLAAIQVIEDEDAEEDTERTVCTPNSKIPGSFSAKDTNVLVTFDNDSTETNVKLTVTGSGITSDVSGQPGQFAGEIASGKKGTPLDIIVPQGMEGTYHVIESNPSLKNSTDGNVKGIVKDDVYANVTTSTPYRVILSEEKGPITVKLYKVEGTSEVLAYTVTIRNKVSFAA